MANGSGRTDPVWKHSLSIDNKARNIKCEYCEKVLTGGVSRLKHHTIGTSSTGGVYRLKQHTIGTSKDVGACIVVPEEVKTLMLDTITMLQQNLMKKSISRDDNSVGDSKNARKEQVKKTVGTHKIFSKEGALKLLLILFSRKVRGRRHVKK